MHRSSSALLTPTLLLACLLAPASAAAQADTLRADTTVFRIEGIEVQSQRPVTTIGGASAVEVQVEMLPIPAAPTGAEV
ncbi:MAG: hypothetical protein R3253_11700, partial [Longimicrobiales bacterium]|nr:hypothetical protein [Longimicrobiales bacterium]